MKRILFAFLVLLVLSMACGTTDTIKDVVNTEANPSAAPTYTPYPTYTQPPTNTPEPTSTNTPVPTPTPRATNTPLPPQAWIYSTTLSDLYTHIYGLGYSAEMYHHSEGYWLIYFYDLTSYFEAEGWYWYGNNITAWAVGGEDKTDDLVDQISLEKNYLTFPTSDIDGKADKFFRKLLVEFGYSEGVIDEIMAIASEGLVHGRDDIDTLICFDQLSTGEYMGVELYTLSFGHYYYAVYISTIPLCESISSGGTS